MEKVRRPDREKVRKKFLEVSGGEEEIHAEKSILWISFLTGTAFAIVEFIFAIYSRSQSVLTDAMYDASELVIIVFTLFLIPLFHKPISEKRPYGFLQLESVFVIIKSCMILSVTVGIAANNINIALNGGNIVNDKMVSIFQFFQALACAFIFLIVKQLNKKCSSPTVETELLEWRLDIWYSGGMSIAFFLGSFLEKTPLAFIYPYFDQLVAVVIICMVLPTNIKILIKAIRDLFLFSPEEDTVNNVKDICDDLMREHGFVPVFYNITRTGRHLWVSVYFRIHEDSLFVNRLYDMNELVQKALDDKIENCTSELIFLGGEYSDSKKIEKNVSG